MSIGLHDREAGAPAVGAGARPLAWWTTPDLQRLVERHRSVFQPWCDGWGVRLDGVSAANAVGWDDTSVAWYGPMEGDGSAALAWLGGPSCSFEAALETLLFDRPASGATVRAAPSIHEVVAARAGEAFVRTLSRAVDAPEVGHFARPADCTDVARHCGRWEGGVVTTLRLSATGACTFHVMQTWATRRASGCAGRTRASGNDVAPSPVIDAIGAQAVTLGVELHAVELSVHDLLSLRPGDFVRLSHGLGDPVLVTHAAAEANGAAPMGRALLGAWRGSRAAAWL